MFEALDYNEILAAVMEDYKRSQASRGREDEARRAIRIANARELIGLFRSGLFGDVTPPPKKRSRRRPASEPPAIGSNEMLLLRSSHMIKMDRLRRKRTAEMEHKGTLPNSADFDAAWTELNAETAALTPASEGTTTGEPASTWLDAPFEQWAIETPDKMFVAKVMAGVRALRPAIPPALPRQPSEYPRRRAPADTDD